MLANKIGGCFLIWASLLAFAQSQEKSPNLNQTLNQHPENSQPSLDEVLQEHPENQTLSLDELLNQASQPGNDLDQVLDAHPRARRAWRVMAQFRELFFHPPALDEAQNPLLGIRYRLWGWDAETQRPRFLNESNALPAGQKFYLELMTNEDGVLYLFHHGSNGQWYRMTPNPRGIGIFRFEERLFPEKGAFVLDQHPGQEELFIVFSKRRVKALEADSELVKQLSLLADWTQKEKHQEKTLFFVGDSEGRPSHAVYALCQTKLFIHRILLRHEGQP